MRDENLILGPCVTEKGTAVGEKANQVVFRVIREASKGAIRQAVEKLFKVTVLKVRTANFLGKKRARGRLIGKARFLGRANEDRRAAESFLGAACKRSKMLRRPTLRQPARADADRQPRTRKRLQLFARPGPCLGVDRHMKRLVRFFT